MSHLLNSMVGAGLPAADIWTQIKNSAFNAKDAAVAVGITLAVMVVCYTFWKAKGAIAALVGAGVVAMIFVWILNNVDNGAVQKTVSDTVVTNGMAPLTPPPVEPDRLIVGS